MPQCSNRGRPVNPFSVIQVQDFPIRAAIFGFVQETVMTDKLFALSLGFAALILVTKAHAQPVFCDFRAGQHVVAEGLNVHAAARYVTAPQSMRSDNSKSAHKTKV